MKIQVLVATMNQMDHSLLKKMNINSDVIVGNQCSYNSVEHFFYGKNHATYLNFNEKGVGLNRNNALMRADADICLFADDDMYYKDNYVEIVENAFRQFKDADIIAFNLQEPVPKRYVIKRISKVGFLNYLRYGTARIAVRLESIKKNAIYFNQCFGGGTEHCHGEDNIFLTECLKKGLRMYAVPVTIAELTEERPSTWDNGYNDKYLHDQGTLYKTISKKFWKLLCLQDCLRRHKRDYKMSWREAYKRMICK